MARLSKQARNALTEERRTQILNAAARVFARKGFERATVSEIAAGAGVSPGLIYTYFKNKGDLLVSIPHQYIQPAIRPLQAELMWGGRDEHRAPQQVLDLLAHNLVRTSTEHGDVLRVMLTSLPSMSLATRAKFLDMVPLFALQALEAYFRQQRTAGVFRPELDPAITARIFPGMLWLFLMLRVVMQLPDAADYEDEQVIAHAISIFLHGVLAKPAAKRKSRSTR